MKRFEKYRTEVTCGGMPLRVSIFLGPDEVGEIYVRYGDLELRTNKNNDPMDQEILWATCISGWGDFHESERDHYMHEAIRRLDAFIDPHAQNGSLDEDEEVPMILEPSLEL